MIPKEIPLRDPAMFRLAMRHRSAAEDSVHDSYERLEFFGDSVLSLVISQYLYENHPDWDQGVMSKARSSVVQEAPLAEAALALGLDRHMELAGSEEASGGRARPGILCDLFEAVVGAIYLESGLEKARWFILERLQKQLALIDSGDVSPMDFKSKLQEVSQSLWRKTPIYRVRVEDGYKHERRFTVEATLDNEVLGVGSGRSKKDAEQSAAQDALDIIARSQRARKESHQPSY